LPDLIAWCGFVGGWLLVFGPLNQAIRELEEEEFERDSITRAERKIDVPPRVSPWWLTVAPVYFILQRRRDRIYKQRVREAMSPEDLQAFAHLREVAGAWFLVAAGASLIAVKETWELIEAYEWEKWSFWALLAIMLALALGLIVVRIRRSEHD
jgi:hypothetical protein